jgi:cytochrome c5
MSAHDHDFPKTTVTQFVLALLGGLFAPALVIFLIVKLVLGIQATHIEDGAAPVAAAQVEERIQPVAEVTVGEPPAPGAEAAGKSGDQVYNQVCVACHGSGAMGAPKLGDKAAWAPRIAQGKDTLVKNAINGIRMMPARGGNPSLSEADVTAAVVYMANSADAGF